MRFSFSSQTLVVIGGARRIGREIVWEAAQSGADVAFSYHTSRREAGELLALLQTDFPDQNFAAYRLNISDGEAVRRMADAVFSQFQNVQGLVNCAAIFRRTPFESLKETDFDAHIAANLKGPFLLCREFGARFLENGRGGSIVNFSDIYAQRPLGNYVPYCISKAGVEMLTRSLAKTLAPHVRVNCIAPGTILPPSETQGEADDDDMQQLIARIPFNRPGTPSEIAAATLFLLSEPTFITGAILPVDGGQSLR